MTVTIARGEHSDAHLMPGIPRRRGHPFQPQGLESKEDLRVHQGARVNQHHTHRDLQPTGHRAAT
ncbi:hypothetical protein C0216_15730 [Streptomyces globosus]|uniref:Uncharacterized protein n=1 Tax=Streptomyces globosus TaxID=68209 RepID=A0A344U1D9_9ACTN|nr:hypothetical protein C0216_15730 [Streptomyces globosus]